jgi:type II secretory pathway component PulL
MERRYLRHSIVMILLFLVAGSSLVLYLFQVYSMFWRTETFNFDQATIQNNSFPPNQSNISFIGERFIRPPNTELALTSPFNLILLFMGVSSTLGGISIWQLTREKELKSAKEDITSLLLTPEEKAIIDELKKANGKLNQNQLVRKTGFSKVKVHRALARLETRKIVKKYPYGLTNKIVLEKTAI